MCTEVYKRTDLHIFTDTYILRVVHIFCEKICIYVYIHIVYICIYVYIYIYIHIFCELDLHVFTDVVAQLKLYVSFAEYSLFYRALLQKRPIIYRCVCELCNYDEYMYVHMYTMNICVFTCVHTHIIHMNIHISILI